MQREKQGAGGAHGDKRGLPEGRPGDALADALPYGSPMDRTGQYPHPQVGRGRDFREERRKGRGLLKQLYRRPTVRTPGHVSFDLGALLGADLVIHIGGQ